MTALERFLRYVTYDTQSSETSETTPSTPKQRLLGKALAQELQDLGLEGAHLAENGAVYAWLPATPGREKVPVLALIAHMDTAPRVPSENVQARVVHYEGGDLVLNQEKGIVTSLKDFPDLAGQVGKDLVVTDGTTLLGADDKAGVAEILTAAETILAENRPHGRIVVGFTPDEEIGRGADRFDVAAFAADYAYTVDGGTLGEIEYENFNGAAATVTLRGKSIHPGSARGKLVNAAHLAMEFHQLLPALEVPAATDGYQGFYHLTHMEGQVEEATLSYIIRDHDAAKFQARCAFFETAAAFLNEKYGPGTATAEVVESYRNMKEQILPHMEIIERAQAAMEACGVTPRVVPIRGGTDGARLSYMGLPCPNLCTGGENFHGRFEFIPLEDMEKVADILERIVLDACP